MTFTNKFKKPLFKDFLMTNKTASTIFIAGLMPVQPSLEAARASLIQEIAQHTATKIKTSPFRKVNSWGIVIDFSSVIRELKDTPGLKDFLPWFDIKTIITAIVNAPHSPHEINPVLDMIMSEAEQRDLELDGELVNFMDIVLDAAGELIDREIRQYIPEGVAADICHLLKWVDNNTVIIGVANVKNTG